MKPALLALALLLSQGAAFGQTFDSHVHLWDGEASIRQYEAQLKAAGQSVAGFGAMWFGGPNQAPAGEIEKTRDSNDGLIALAAKHPGMLPIATVHPYDGHAAVAELERVASRGIKVLKLHAHTQKFDVTDPRVLTLVRRAGDLGIVVLMDNASIIPGDSENLFNLALKSPKTKFIFAHMGGAQLPLLEHPGIGANCRGPVRGQHLFRHLRERGHRCGFTHSGGIRLDRSQRRH